MQVNMNETSLVVKEDVQNGGFSHAESIIHFSKKLQDDLHNLGVKIKEHEENLKLLKIQRHKLDDSILDMQVILGKHHSLSPPMIASELSSLGISEEEMNQHILQYEKSAAALLCQLKTRHGTQASHLTVTKDIVGIVAALGKVEDDNLSRLLSEYLGLDTMLAIVCKTYEGVKALEIYDSEGCTDKISGLHGLSSSIGRTLDGRFVVICLENLRPYAGEFVADDPQRRLDILKPRLPNGEFPAGFLGFAVNMINLERAHLFCVTPNGYGLRETLFYNLFSHLQVYRTRKDMMQALPCISEGALSLDGGLMRSNGVFSLGNRDDLELRFPRPPIAESYSDIERQVEEMKQRRDQILEDAKREQMLLDISKLQFHKKKNEFLKFLAESSSVAAQVQTTQIS